jgi:hypothetical protein
MKEYIGVKSILARQMNRADYNIYRGWELPSDEDGSDNGYLVEYNDTKHPNHPLHKGYISWSPKEVFDESYGEIGNFNIITLSLKPHQQRVIDEFCRLKDNVIKLDEFINNNKIFEGLEINEKNRLSQQLLAMKCYLSILKERINNF